MHAILSVSCKTSWSLFCMDLAGCWTVTTGISFQTSCSWISGLGWSWCRMCHRCSMQTTCAHEHIISTLGMGKKINATFHITGICDMSYSIAVTESVLHGICVCAYNEWHINAGGATHDLAPRATAEVTATVAAGAERPEVLPSGVAVDLPATSISVASPGDGHGLGQGHLSWNSGWQMSFNLSLLLLFEMHIVSVCFRFHIYI